MWMVRAALAVFLVGCSASSATIAASDPADSSESGGSGSAVAGDDAQVPPSGDVDAGQATDPPSSTPPADPPPSVPPPVPPPPPPTDSGADVTPPTDAGGTVDAGPCVKSVTLPESPTWTIWANYDLSATTSQSVPYGCSVTDGTACRSALMSMGALQSGAHWYVYPAAGACHINVPTKCLPCTGTVTQW